MIHAHRARTEILTSVDIKKSEEVSVYLNAHCFQLLENLYFYLKVCPIQSIKSENCKSSYSRVSIVM